MTTTTRELPLYISHKKVRALEIKSVADDADVADSRKVHFTDARYAAASVPEIVFLRYTPSPGDFYVVYEDGYVSFSPAKAFTEGYKLAEA